jgi:hypothetical protein
MGGLYPRPGRGIQDELFHVLTEHGFGGNFWDPMNPPYSSPQKFVMLNQKPRKKLYVTGHSSGGALAQIFAADLIQRELFYQNLKAKVNVESQEQSLEELICTGATQPTSLENVVIFGTPRFASFSFAKCFNRAFPKRIWRVTLKNDLVTKIPPSILGYRHFGESYFISSNYELMLNPENSAVSKDRLGAFFKGIVSGHTDAVKDGLLDHMSYANAINHMLNPLCSPTRIVPSR